MGESNRLHIVIPPELDAMLRQEAKDSGLSIAEIVRNAVWQMFQNRFSYIKFVNQQFEAAQLEDGKNE